MKLTAFDWIIWVANAAGNLSLAFWMLRSQERKRFPVFLSLIAYRGFKSVALIAIYLAFGYSAYFYAYWSNACLQYFWLIGVLIEVGIQVAAPYGPVPKRIAGSLVTVSAAAAATMAIVEGRSPSAVPFPLEAMISSLVRSADFSWITAFVILALASSWFGLGWRREENGIAAGLCLEMMSAALTDLLFQWFGFRYIHSASQVVQIVSLFSFLPWFWVFKKRSLAVVPVPVKVVRSVLQSLEIPISR